MIKKMKKNWDKNQSDLVAHAFDPKTWNQGGGRGQKDQKFHVLPGNTQSKDSKGYMRQRNCWTQLVSIQTFFFFSLRYSARDSVSGSSDTVSSVSSWSSWTSHWLESCDYCPTGSSLCFLRLEGWRQEAWELCFHFLRNGTLEKWGSGKKAFCLDLPYLEGTEGSVSFSSLGPASDSDWPLMNQGFWRLLLFQQSNTVNFFLIPRASFLLKCSWSWETYWYIITNN